SVGGCKGTKKNEESSGGLHAYAWKSTHMRAAHSPAHAYVSPLHLGVTTQLIRATHMRRSPRLCVESH
ncbi:hypothetical protein PIB30_110378, partial [Stylosanthes scabra]|nr:hypothetical protein [Stylosanthes scabra]